jgi:PAS domain S-box-containing protein
MLVKLVDAAAVGMVVSDMDGRMVYANAAFAALLGRGIDGADTDLFALIHPDDSAAARQRLTLLMRGEASEYRGEHRFRHADGTPLWVMVAASLLRSDSG